MKYLAATITIFSVLICSAAALAATPHIACVQQGLLDAGYDPNGIDGSLGGGTRAAAEAYLAASNANLPELSDESAEEWCIAMGGATFVVQLVSTEPYDGFLNLLFLEWQMEDVMSVGATNDTVQFKMMTDGGQSVRTITLSADEWSRTSHVLITAWGNGWDDVTDWEGSQYNHADTQAAPEPGPDGLHRLVMEVARE